jgi:nucleoside-diphosphate-sugar epimerase
VLYTSGLGVLGETGGEPADEYAPTAAAMQWRVELEDEVRTAGGVALRPGLVYGHGGGDILTGLIAAAREFGRAAYAAPGADRPWPNVHVDDLGTAYALAVTSAPPASVYNVSGGSATPRTVNEAIARALGVPAVAIDDPEEAARLPLGGWLGMRQVIDTKRIRSGLGWAPTAVSLVDDLEHGSYSRS